jgi:TonB family protein
MPGIDILDQRDPLGKPLTGSLLFHGGLLAFILVAPQLLPKPIRLGDPTHNSGSIGVNVVKTIPIPQREAPENRVANDTQSTVPQKPEPKVAPKPVVKEKPVPDNAIKIPTKVKEKPKKTERASTTNPFLPNIPYKPNQVFSETPQAMKAPEFGIQGTNGIGVGQANPFGDQYGWYAQQIFDRVGQKWNRADVTSRPQARAIVRFTLLKNGTVQNMKLVQPSGSYTLDNSAQRAVLDAVLPPFPRGFNYNAIDVDLTFELQQ